MQLTDPDITVTCAERIGDQVLLVRALSPILSAKVPEDRSLGKGLSFKRFPFPTFYSSSPFIRMINLIGVPWKPKVSRRQFSMKRW